MAPPPKSEDEVFLDKLAKFHEERGTPFDRDPKVAGRPINLHILYQAVVREGGYDVLSAERMRWRALTKEFSLGHHHEAAMTFQLKTVYYRYLTAYEIKDFWDEEPPPPEIVEHLTAKGGDVRKRTLENYQIPGTRESLSLAENPESDEETPQATEPDDSASRYPSRLRQDPKRTQMFQPETTPRRRLSPIHSHSHSADPRNSHSADPRNSHFEIGAFAPKRGMVMALRPVQTQGNDPEHFRTQPPQDPVEAQHSLKHVSSALTRGPNIYIRCLYGLRSGIPQEQEFALHHLVKVSYERGEKYRFEGFPQLAEALLEKTLEVSTLVHGIKWTVSYDESATDDCTLNGIAGTPGLLEKVQNLPVLLGDSLDELARLNEASLVIRNMCLLEENAAFISRFALLKDYLVICLNLPDDERLAELRQNVLDTAETVTKYWELDCESPVYKSLIRCLWCQDRGAILTALHAISRINMDGPKANQLKDIPLATIKTLVSFLLLECDDEIMLASLDILYQYTALPENQLLLWNDDESTVRQLIPRLVSLLLYNAKQSDHKMRFGPDPTAAPVTDVQVAPDDLYDQLLTYAEPERSTNWLKCCFEESLNVDITQIVIWQAYQGRFLQNNPIAASEFIKNVSNTFSSAQAQVVQSTPPRFIIKGIRPKKTVTDPAGTPFMRCLWTVEDVPCMSWHRDAKKLWTHLLADHLGVPRVDGKFGPATGSYTCHWINCTKHTEPETDAAVLAKHVRVHIPAPEARARSTPSPEAVDHSFYNTPVDEHGPYGIPYMAVLTLKNFARFALRHQGQIATGETLMQTLFDDVKPELWRVIAFNRNLRVETDHLMHIISQDSAAPRPAGRSPEDAFIGVVD